MKGSLLKAEVHRFRSRRFIVVLLLLGLAVFGTVVVVSFTQYAKPSAAGLADAKQRASAFVAEQQRNRDQCLSSVPPGKSAEMVCGPPGELSGVPIEEFIDKKPFVLAKAGPGFAKGIAVATSVLLFLVGATWVGAEWSTKSMVALLFWVPRRVTVITTKLGVLLGAAALIGVVAQGLWLLAAHLLGSTRGTTDGLPAGFYGDLLALQGRGVLLGVFIAAFGFAVANLIRNTGAALGVGFVYFAIVENAVRGLRPSWVPALLTSNAGALLLPDGLRVFVRGTVIDAGGNVLPGREVVLSHLHGGLVLGGVAAVLVTAGVVLFARRDLQ